MLGLLSDRRFKTDIKAVGKTDDGLTVYTYRYTDNAPVDDAMKGITMMGVMADEVKEVKPDAVTTIDGIDRVDYGAI